MENLMYIFNPENDMALANNTIYYKAPKEILRMADDLSVLPVWYAESGSLVKIADYASNASLMEHYEKKGVHTGVGLVCRFLDTALMPWGWSPSLIHRLVKEGVSSFHLPSVNSMCKIRSLSGRQISRRVLEKVQNLEFVCGHTVECFSLAEVEAHLKVNGQSMLKSPWSGSGRGLMKIDSVALDSNLIGWISRIIRSQGSIMVEPLFNKVVDFAMEFYSGREGVNFCGYSMFETDHQGNYKSNVMASDSFLEQKICKWVDREHLFEIRHLLVELFNELLSGNYQGYFGVDMMICLYNGVCKIHPCVEVNLRMNMGVIARIIYDRYICCGVNGKYIVEHFFADDEAVLFYNEMSASYPAVYRNGRFASGYFPLTPVKRDTRFHVYVLIE